MAIFFCIVVILSIFRLKVGEKFDIRNSDILLAIIPVALWLILTGRIQKLEFGEFKIEAAFVEASKSSVKAQIKPVKLPVEPLVMGLKGSPKMIQKLIKNKTEALVFRLGNSYYGPAIEEYLERLTEYPFFKYIVINEEDGRFFAIADARALNSYFKSREEGLTSWKFADWLKNSDKAFLSSELPGFISKAIILDTDKKTALELMEKFNVDILPVVDKWGKFLGIVDRSRITASLIIEMANKLK